MWKRVRWIALAMVMMFAMVLAACGNSSEGSDASNENKDQGASNDDEKSEDTIKLGDKEVQLVTDTYVSNTVNAHVGKRLLNELGYKASVKQADPGVEYSGLAGGSADASLAAWLPYTHESYWKKYKDKLDKMSVVTKKVKLGLTVPSYMKEINSIEDLADNKNNVGKKLDWKITGISPGAGEMKITKNKVIPSYGLEKWDLQESSGPAMATTLSKAIDNKEPIVVTLWTPHWTFNKFDLKILKDPKNKYGKPDNIYSVSRKGFKEDSPAAYKLLSQIHVTKKQTQGMMLDLQNGMEADKAAKKFIKNHPDLKKEWMKGINVEK